MLFLWLLKNKFKNKFLRETERNSEQTMIFEFEIGELFYIEAVFMDCSYRMKVEMFINHS